MSVKVFACCLRNIVGMMNDFHDIYWIFILSWLILKFNKLWVWRQLLVLLATSQYTLTFAKRLKADYFRSLRPNHIYHQKYKIFSLQENPDILVCFCQYPKFSQWITTIHEIRYRFHLKSNYQSFHERERSFRFLTWIERGMLT